MTREEMCARIDMGVRVGLLDRGYRAEVVVSYRGAGRFLATISEPVPRDVCDAIVREKLHHGAWPMTVMVKVESKPKGDRGEC